MTPRSFQKIYDTLYDYYGPQGWWPADSPLEMIVGAVLTQNTNWQNVEKAIANLKTAGFLSIEILTGISSDTLAQLIMPAGYYNLKAKRLKNLLQMLDDEYGGDVSLLQDDNFSTARENLLRVKGVGEETADAILLYGCGKPVFVVDTYTHRVFSRHNLLEEECSYGEIQERFMDNLPADAKLFNEYHALIVKVAKDFCKKSKPLCDECPLREREPNCFTS